MNILEEFVQDYESNWEENYNYWSFLVYKKEKGKATVYDIRQVFNDDESELEWSLQESEGEQLVQNLKYCNTEEDIEQWETMWLDYYPLITDEEQIEFLEKNEGMIIEVNKQ